MEARINGDCSNGGDRFACRNLQLPSYYISFAVVTWLGVLTTHMMSSSLQESNLDDRNLNKIPALKKLVVIF